MLLDIPPTVQAVVDLIISAGGRVYAVGGCIRDNLRNQSPKDIDLATTLYPTKLLKLDQSQQNGYLIHVVPSGILFGTATFVVQKDGEKTIIEVTTLREDISCNGRKAEVKFTKNILVDLARRDFTINAMAVEFTKNNCSGELIDPFNGQKDLESRIIRAVGDPIVRFKEDYLRTIRACRFAGYGFYIEHNTKEAITACAPQVLDYVAKERIRDELLKMMATWQPFLCIDALKDTNLLASVIPPLAKCIGVTQNFHHNETVYEHCIAVCNYLLPNNPILRLAGLLHDVGKPEAKVSIGDSCSFHNHEILGARIVYNFAKKYHFSNDDCEYLSTMIRWHMFHFDLDSSKKTIKKWLRKVKGLHTDLLELRKADRAGNKAKIGRPLVTNYMQDLMDKIKEIEDYKEPMKITDLEFSGLDLIAMGYSPGPLFREILGALLERVLDDPSLNTNKALKSIVENEYDPQ